MQNAILMLCLLVLYQVLGVYLLSLITPHYWIAYFAIGCLTWHLQARKDFN